LTLAPTQTGSEGRADKPGRLVVISGPSGSGKSTIVDRLLDPPRADRRRSISMTTRPIRPGEVDGVNYFFVDRAEFEADRDLGAFLEWAEVHGHLYGTPARHVEESLAGGVSIFLVIDVQGGMNVREKLPDALLVFLHAPDPATLEARLRDRGTDSEGSIRLRLENARREVALSDKYDAQIVNDDLDRAVAQLAAILDSHQPGG